MTGVMSPLAGSFAQAPATAESIIAQVHRELVADDAGAPTRQPEELDLLAETAVRTLWGGRVTTFVSVLALRDAREALRARRSAPQGSGTDGPGTRNQMPGPEIA